jgi:branched-chain amino acid transport system ATP-binding protein
MTSTMLSCEGLYSGYLGEAAVRDIDLEVHAGQVVLLAGRNGAGKTTTLMTLAGAIKPLSGRVRVRGAESSLPLHRRVREGLGLITEGRCVVRGLSVEENLRLGRGDMRIAFEHFPELERLRKVKAGLVSGGEQQMLVVGRVLASKPEVILADELSQGLAPIIVRRLLDVLRAAADEGVAVLLVEQHLRLGLEIADHVYFLRQGRVHGSNVAGNITDADIEAAYF